eukprot:gene4015-7271_t
MFDEEKPTVILTYEDGKDFLFLGDKYHAKDKELLKELNVTHILNVTSQVDNFHPSDFEYMKIDINDTVDSYLYDDFQEIHKFVSSTKKKKGKVLVHCSYGVSRSATAVICYIMKSEKKKFEETLIFVQEKRPIVKPNLGFMKQLVQLEREIHGEVFFNWNQHLKELGFNDSATLKKFEL